MHKKTLSSGSGELGCREHLDGRDTNKSGNKEMVTEGLSIGNIADMIVIKHRQLRWIELHVDAGKLKLELN
jgi:hypothetical protein